jgi:hypothetical protein
VFEVRYVRQHDGVFVIHSPPASKRAAMEAALFISVSQMPKRVYLDSSDFSNLSVPDEELSHEHRAILETLRDHKRAGRAIYFMSPVHLSEAVHAAESHKQTAVRRAELMRELCGPNILRIPTDLPELELKRAMAGQKNIQLSLDEITSHEGEWFGVSVPLGSMPAQRESIRRQITALLDNLPRRERRKRRSELDFRKKSSHPKWRELMARSTQMNPPPYPFNLVDQKTAIDWVLEEVSDHELRKRTLKLVHDPYIMFKYLLEDKDSRERLYNSLRKAGAGLVDECDDRQLIVALSPFAKSQVDPSLTAMVNDFYSRPATLRKFISIFAAEIDNIPDMALQNIVDSCPSLSTFVAINKSKLASQALSYLARIRSGNMSVKQRKPSDLGDLMHSYYAPYFDIFRCDASFGMHLKSHKPIKTKIADRIGDLSRMLSDISPNAARDVA